MKQTNEVALILNEKGKDPVTLGTFKGVNAMVGWYQEVDEEHPYADILAQFHGFFLLSPGFGNRIQRGKYSLHYEQANRTHH